MHVSSQLMMSPVVNADVVYAPVTAPGIVLPFFFHIYAGAEQLVVVAVKLTDVPLVIDVPGFAVMLIVGVVMLSTPIVTVSLKLGQVVVYVVYTDATVGVATGLVQVVQLRLPGVPDKIDQVFPPNSDTDCPWHMVVSCEIVRLGQI